MTALILSDEQELELVGWYWTFEIFYNQRLKEFKLKDNKDRLMSEKANTMHNGHISAGAEDLAELHLWEVGKAEQVR